MPRMGGREVLAYLKTDGGSLLLQRSPPSSWSSTPDIAEADVEELLPTCEQIAITPKPAEPRRSRPGSTSRASMNSWLAYGQRSRQRDPIRARVPAAGRPGGDVALIADYRAERRRDRADGPLRL